jgi:hydroxymethylpyrimidine/phosphomethylpyrimidine kinase
MGHPHPDSRTARPIVLSIAGFDPSGGAGLTSDLAVMQQMGVRGMAVATLITAQNSCEVRASHCLDAHVVAGQLNLLLDDVEIAAVKIGALGTADIVQEVAGILRQRFRGPIVLDPVLHASSGTRLLSEQGTSCLASQLVPLATVVTTNRMELETLTGSSITTLEQMEQAARWLASQGATWILAKGGHLDSGSSCTDLLCQSNQCIPISHPRIPGDAPHGTGCALSSAVASGIALGMDVPKACLLAKETVFRWIQDAFPLGKGARFLL